MARRPKFQREKDLLSIEKRYLRGERQHQIAVGLGVSQVTVSNDLRELQKRWRAETVRDLDDAKAQELAKVDELEREYWDAWQNSCEDAETIRQEASEKKVDKVIKTAKGQAGDPRFLAGVQWCIEKRCKILGLDAPDKHEVDHKFGKMTDDELREYVQGAIRDAGISNG